MNERKLELTNNEIYTVGKIFDIEFGGKTADEYRYYFFVKNIKKIGGQVVNYKMVRDKPDKYNYYIGKSFFVKYSIEKPKYNELLLEHPVPDSLLNCTKCVWKKIPTVKDVKIDKTERLGS